MLRFSPTGCSAGSARGWLIRLGSLAKVERVRDLLDGEWRSAIVDAAWLHDIGYSPRVQPTGFHALDAARWLRARGWPTATCRLVAWHTEAEVEGAVRGLGEDLAAEFEPPPALAAAGPR